MSNNDLTQIKGARFGDVFEYLLGERAGERTMLIARHGDGMWTGLDLDGPDAGAVYGLDALEDPALWKHVGAVR